MQDPQDVLQELLSRKKLKNTLSRQHIINMIFSADKHFTAETLMDDLKKKGTAVSKATVYRTLAVLADAGLLIEHDFGTGEKHYENASDKAHHDHLVCDRCHAIVEFYDDLEDKLIEKISAKYQFEVQHHVFKIYGLCSKCRNK